MKHLSKTLPGLLLAALPLTVDAGLIVGWDTWSSGDETASVTPGDATGLGSETGDWRENKEAASNDGTFGDLIAGASTAVEAASSGTYIGQTGGAGTYSFTVTAGAQGLVIEGFHFDARRKRSNSPENWSVEVTAGAITLGAIANGTLGNTLGGPGPSDHDDFDFDLTTFADNELAPGESATIRISWSGGNPTNTDQKTYLDNVAITGQFVPEPSSLALLALGGLMLSRRKSS